jgi:hypothetical protein
MVDDFLLQRFGLDYTTLEAKQAYFDHLANIFKVFSHPTVAAARRRLRLDIVEIAEAMWRENAVPQVRASDIRMFKDLNVVPTQELRNFLFPPHSIDPTAIYQPLDRSKAWLHDPVELVRYTRDCVNLSHNWKRQKAVKMMQEVVQLPRQGPLGQALEKFHIRRCRNELDSEAILAVDQANLQPKIEAYKLYLFLDTPRAFTGGAALTPRGREEAKKALGRLVQATITCADTGCAVAPRGVEAMVQHMRWSHPLLFFGSRDWTFV